MEYKFINYIGLKVHDKPIPHVKHEDLRKVLRKKKITRIFGKYFGVQTCIEQGFYAWDVEDVLVRIFTGRAVGTQRWMD